jgi:hypothetical protein
MSFDVNKMAYVSFAVAYTSCNWTLKIEFGFRELSLFNGGRATSGKANGGKAPRNKKTLPCHMKKET